MSGHTLPADVARCAGVGSDAEGWRDGCDDCLRRLAPPVDPERVLRILPPVMVVFWCEAHMPAATESRVSPSGNQSLDGASGPAAGVSRQQASFSWCSDDFEGSTND